MRQLTSHITKIGDAQEPLENEGLVEALQDDAFSVTVKEIGKAVGWKKKAKRKSAASEGSQESEAQKQIAQVLAERLIKILSALSMELVLLLLVTLQQLLLKQVQFSD